MLLSMINRKTGDRVLVDTEAARIDRLRRRVRAWAAVLEPLLGRHRLVMVTLTYRPTVDWRPGDIREFMLGLRKSCGVGLLAYAWVAELQARGAVHYHVLVLVRHGTNVPRPDVLWAHGLTRIETARSVWYIVKYAQKGGEGGPYFPRGLRAFAVWISKDTISGVARFVFRCSALVGWLAELVHSYGVFPTHDDLGYRFELPGGGFARHSSPWEREGFGRSCSGAQLHLRWLRDD